MEITLGQQYNVGEKPIVILYSYINRRAGTPEKNSKNNIDRALTIPSNIRGYQSGTMWFAGKDQKKGTITHSTCQKKIGHSIERFWYSANREPSSK